MAVEILNLDDGTVAVLDHRPGSGRLTSVVVALEGSLTDPAANPGSAHILEHILASTAAGKFKTGLDYHGAVEQRHSGSIEAETDRELMFLAARSFNQEAVDLIELLRTQLQENRILNGYSDSDEFDSVRKNVIHEIREERQSQTTIRSEIFKRELLRGTPYARINSIGTIGTTENITELDLRKHFKRLMARRRAIVVSGGFHLPNVRQALTELEIGTKPKLPIVNPKEVQSVDRPVVKRIPFGSAADYIFMRIGYRTAKRRHMDAYPLYLLADYLATGYTSRLHREIVGELELGYGLYGVHFTFDDVSGAFYVDLEVPPQNVERVSDAFAGILEEVREVDLGEGDLLTLKRRSLAAHLMEVDSDAKRAEWFAHQALFYPDDIRDVEEFHDLLAPLRSDDLRRAAAEYFRPERFIGVLVGPVDDKEMQLRALTKRKGSNAGER